MPATQTRECEIREENLQTITSTHGFYLHGLNRRIPPPKKLWTPLCIDSCLYAYRVYMVCTKTVEEVAKAYMDHIYSNFGGSIKILTDNGMEFKNKLFKKVVKKLGTEFSFTPLQTTEQWKNRRISQISENMYWQAHQLRIGVGRAHTNGNSML